MIERSSEESIRAETAAASKADSTALPLLRTYRETLEKEAGALSSETRRYHILLIVLGSIAVVFGLYSLLMTLTADPPIVGWVVTAIFAIGAGGYAQHRNSTQRERATHLKELHEKMLAAGRRIDGAERRLRS